MERRLRSRVQRDPILRTVREASQETGVPVWLVGGMIRDIALGRRVQDVDLAAGKRASILVHHLEAAWNRHAFRFRKRGVTTWRIRVESREVDLVDAGGRGIERDLFRREFTVNAMAFDLKGGPLLDPTGGLRDLRAGLLRLPRPGVVAEDPIRALRAARFLAQFPQLRLHTSIKREAAASVLALRRASIERVRDEVDTIVGSAAPDRGLEALERLGLLVSVLPELLPLTDCVAGLDRPSVWRHTLDALARRARPGRLPGARSVSNDPEASRILGWALLLHDISKPETISHAPDGRPTFHGHETLGARRAAALLRRMLVPRSLRKRIVRLVLFHLRPHHLTDAGAPARGLRRLVRDAGLDLPVLVLHAACDALASGGPEQAARWRRLRAVLWRLMSLHEEALRESPPPLVNGGDVMTALGIDEGPEVGRVLRRIEELREEGRLRTRRDALLYLAARPRGDTDREEANLTRDSAPVP